MSNLILILTLLILILHIIAFITDYDEIRCLTFIVATLNLILSIINFVFD